MTSVGTGFYPSPSAPVYSDVDARIDAVVLFSPTGPGFGGFWEDGTGSSWDTMEGPALTITGENDVKPDNTASLMGQPDIDGALVGGASLDPRSFAQIVLGSKL